MVNRKVWGGNRTWRGAGPQGVLTSLLVTLRRDNALTFQQSQRSRAAANGITSILPGPTPSKIIVATAVAAPDSRTRPVVVASARGSRMSDSENSISAWLDGVKNGESRCAQELYHQVYDRLARLARRRLIDRPLGWADEEDVALSAFHSFCTRAAEGKFPQLANRDDLWKILVTITYRKCGKYLEHERAQKRGGGTRRDWATFGDIDRASGGIQDPRDESSPPDVAALVADQCRHLLDILGDDTLRQVAVWKMEGFTDKEVATKLDCVVRTVERKVERIRLIWSKQVDNN